jgi:hypothetical protein
VSAEERIRTNTKEIWADIEGGNTGAFDVALPEGEPAYWTLPRSQTEWRLPGQTPLHDGAPVLEYDTPTLIPVRTQIGIPETQLVVMPQPYVLHKRVAERIEEEVTEIACHMPVERGAGAGKTTLAQARWGVPSMILRVDAIIHKNRRLVGNVHQIGTLGEADDVPSLWPVMQDMQPIAESYLIAWEDQIGLPIYTAELYEYGGNVGYGPVSPELRALNLLASIYFGVTELTSQQRSEGMRVYDTRILQATTSVAELEHLYTDAVRYVTEGTRPRPTTMATLLKLQKEPLEWVYQHQEDHWRGDFHNSRNWPGGRQPSLDEVALILRARPGTPGFDEHMAFYGSRSLTLAGERDRREAMAAARLGSCAASAELALEFAEKWLNEYPDKPLVLKSRGARTEHVAIVTGKGTKREGESSLSQARRKLATRIGGSVLIQLYDEADSLADGKVTFYGGSDDKKSDRSYIQAGTHVGRDPGKYVVPGREKDFKTVFRGVLLYMPELKRYQLIGGMVAATKGRIVHLGAHSLGYSMYIDGQMGHPGVKPYRSLEYAEKMMGTARDYMYR